MNPFILLIAYGPIVTLIVTKTINNRFHHLFIHHEIGRRGIERFPLTATNYYRFFYHLTPLLGGLGGLVGMLGAKSAGQLLLGIAFGTMGSTILLYLLIDPITTLLEYFFSRSYKYPISRFHDTGKTVQANLLSHDEPERRAEKWVVSLSFWIPRKYREAIVGDMLEDCHELRELGKSEHRIWVHVLWQLVIALVLLWPASIKYTLSRIWHTIIS